MISKWILDHVAKEQRRNVIYSIPCNDCNQEYVGRTKRQFGTRLKEHQKAVFHFKSENWALSEHKCQTKHTIAWDNSKIVKYQSAVPSKALFGGLGV